MGTVWALRVTNRMWIASSHGSNSIAIKVRYDEVMNQCGGCCLGKLEIAKGV